MSDKPKRMTAKQLKPWAAMCAKAIARSGAHATVTIDGKQYILKYEDAIELMEKLGAK